MWHSLIPPVIRIDIPALTEYVAFLRDSRKQQQEIDALVVRMNATQERLQAVIDSSKP